MPPNLNDLPRPLAHGHLLTLPHASGCVIHCLTGCLWITETGDPGDHLLIAGQAYPVRGTGRLVIEALGNSCLRLTPITEPAPPRRLSRLHRPVRPADMKHGPSFFQLRSVPKK